MNKLYFYYFQWWFVRKSADVQMEGQFLVRQIYEDEITYNLIFAAVELLRKYTFNTKTNSIYLFIHLQI